MKLQITHLKEGENSFRFVSDRDGWMKEVESHIEKRGLKLESPLEVEMNLTKLEPDYYLRGLLKGKVSQTCARCAESFALPLRSPFELAFAHVSSEKARGTELSDESEEIDVNFFEGHEIDLSPVIEEQFFLSLPFKALCQPNCKGICQKCGQNLNQGSCQCPSTEKTTPFSVLQKYKL